MKWTQRSADAHLVLSLQDTRLPPSPQDQVGISLLTPKYISFYHFGLFTVQGATFDEFLHSGL